MLRKLVVTLWDGEIGCWGSTRGIERGMVRQFGSEPFLYVYGEESRQIVSWWCDGATGAR